MKTTATSRKTAPPRRAAPAPLRAGGGASGTAARKPAVRKPASGATTRRPAATGNASSAARRTTTTTTTAKKPFVIRKPRWNPPPRPPMYWICYDFTIKLVRGLCLGIGIGLCLTVVLPWVLDVGFMVVDTVQDASLPDISNFTPDFSSWNETTQRFWRVDQSSYLRRPINTIPPTAAPTLDPRVVADQQLFQKFTKRNRTIALVHVGHTGGRALIQSCPSWLCKEQFPRDAEGAQACIQKQIQRRISNPNNTPYINSVNATQHQQALPPLAQQAQYYFHLGDVQHPELQQSTSFLFTLRNPVDRILAIFADAHPLACTNPTAPPHQRPWGCETSHYWNLPNTPQYTLFHACFPRSPVLALEEFAQAVLSPWTNITGENKLVQTIQEQYHDCRWMAREMVLGSAGSDDDANDDAQANNVPANINYNPRSNAFTAGMLTPLAPHMHFNYDYYARQSLWKYSGQEILAIRSEYESIDLPNLHRLLGATPAQLQEQQQFLSSFSTSSSSSSSTMTPLVSLQAYGKLCCVLQQEIEIYETILRQVANLPPYAKEESMEALRQNCGLPEHQAWAEWRIFCKNQMEIDSFMLTP